MTVTIDSRVYNTTFYGILNANGAFWTPLAFESEEKAEAHLRDFWKGTPPREWQGRRAKSFKIVPVHIQLTALPASVDGSAKRQDAAGGLIGEADDSAVPAKQGDAQ